jgi:modulator of FtsH protease HflK
MSEHDHPHVHDEPKAPAPMMPEDAGSRALSDALRSSFFIVKILMAALVVLFLASGMFTVGPQERVVLLRFGKPVGQGDAALLGPGFHWAFPAPIDEKVRIPYSQVQVANSTVGWYATTPEMEAARNEPPPRPTLSPAVDGYALTADANIIHVRAALRYRITDPLQYIFAFHNTPGLVTNALNNAILFAAAQFTVDDALTRNQTAFSEKVAARVSQLALEHKLGIAVEQVSLTPKAPRQLAEKFNAVTDAAVKRDKSLNGARSYANEALSRAKGTAATRIALAQSERTRLVEAVAAEAKRFSDVLPQYQANPELFMRLRQAEVVQRVLTNAQERIYLSARSDGKARTLRIDLSREPQKPKQIEQPKADDHH